MAESDALLLKQFSLSLSLGVGAGGGGGGGGGIAYDWYPTLYGIVILTWGDDGRVVLKGAVNLPTQSGVLMESYAGEIGRINPIPWNPITNDHIHVDTPFCTFAFIF